MGDYSNRLPNQNALDAVDELIAWLERRNYLNRSCYEFAGHRDHGNTLCPGDPLYGNFSHFSTLTYHFKLFGDRENIHTGTKAAKYSVQAHMISVTIYLLVAIERRILHILISSAYELEKLTMYS